jgi:hypothetical protein
VAGRDATLEPLGNEARHLVVDRCFVSLSHQPLSARADL